MKSNEYKDYATIFKALSDETRLKIVEMISCEEMCACDILDFFQISQSTLSYHMKILTECNVVKSRKDGPWVKYVLNKDEINKITGVLEELTIDNDSCICNSDVYNNYNCNK